MNKKEAIERIGSMTFLGKTFEGIKAEVAEIISQIHEPQKPVIPQFVAEWISLCKRDGKVLKHALTDAPYVVLDWLEDGLGDASFSTFARAWLDGYEVEREKLYVVTDGNKLYLKKFDELNAVIIIDDVVGATDYAKRYSDKTEAQKAADELGWIVKEVE